MKQVIQSARTGKLRVVEVPDPLARPGHVVVRTEVSLISAGTERMVVDFAQKSLVSKARARPDLVRKTLDKLRRDGPVATVRSVLARLDEPLPLGYSATGVVTEIGAGLEGIFHVGQRVAMAGAGVANHAELSLVPRNLLAPVPDNVPADHAAFGTLAAVALHGIRNLSPGLGDIVCVIGAGLIGLIAVRLLVLQGVRVVVLDFDSRRLEIARQFGAELALSSDSDVDGSVRMLSNGRGVDGILITAADESNAPLVQAARVTRDRARVVLVGKTGTDFPFADYMKRELSIIVSRSYGPGRYDDEYESHGVKYPVGFVRWTETENLAECLRLMSQQENGLDVRPLITHRFDISDAEKAYELVLERQHPHLGVLLKYAPSRPRHEPIPAVRTEPKERCTIGVIGAGVFARTVLLPALKNLGGVRLATVVTTRGATAEHARATFGFQNAALDPRAIFDDPGINGVVVATSHDSHARLAAAALAANKSVLVEKPLALDRAGLVLVESARRHSTGFLMVGFNRRFAPMARLAKEHLANLPGPRVIAIRVNAGVPPTKPDDSGRVLGEVCHFVDLARFLAGAAIRSVQAVGAPRPEKLTADDVVVTLTFAEGSIATITYTGLGDAADIKERIEVFAAGTVVRIEDFRSITVVANGRVSRTRSRLTQDKGHINQLKVFVTALQKGGPALFDEGEIIETSLATIAIGESLRSGGRIDIDSQ